MKERAADFMRTFPEKKLCYTKLAKIYREHKVRKKKIKITKVLNDDQLARIQIQVPQVRESLQGCYADGFRVIYLDEMMVTTSKIPTHEWIKKNASIHIDHK